MKADIADRLRERLAEWESKSEDAAARLEAAQHEVDESDAHIIEIRYALEHIEGDGAEAPTRRKVALNRKRPGEVERAVFDEISGRSALVSPQALAEQLLLPLGSVRPVCKRLAKKGRIIEAGGLYGAKREEAAA